MFTRDVTIGRYRVRIEISENPPVIKGNSFLFGYPYGGNLDSIRTEKLPSVLNNIKGYFLYLNIEDDRITIASDLTGGYRLYYYESGNEIYFSDRYQSLLDIMKRFGSPEDSTHEYHYWEKHGYTTGGSTLITNLLKLPPATIMEIMPAEIRSRLYFQDLPNHPDRNKHCLDVATDLKNSLAEISKQPEKIVLFFSGGDDSTLLALMLKELEVDCEAVFLHALPRQRANQDDFLFAQIVAKQIGLNLTVMDVDLNVDSERLKEIANEILFDRHFAILHFEGLKEIVRKYGSEVIVVNGQASDSILSFGPSGKTLGDFTARVLLYRPHSLWSRLASRMVERRFGMNFTAPTSSEEYLRAFFDQFEYYTVGSDRDSADYCKYLDSIIERTKTQLKQGASLLMYLKLFGFIQGSDNQVVIQSARAAGISRVVLPYATPAIIYSTVQNKSNFFDLMRPKYAISQSLKQFDYHRPSAKPSKDDADFKESDAIKRGVEKAFLDRAKDLIGDVSKWPNIS